MGSLVLCREVRWSSLHLALYHLEQARSMKQIGHLNYSTASQFSNSFLSIAFTLHAVLLI